MAVDLPIRAHLDSDGVEQLISALREVGKMAGMSEKELDDLSNKARESGKAGASGINEYNKSLESLINNGLRRATQAVTGFIAAHKLIRIGEQIFKLTAQYQKFSGVLQNALGSRSAAQESMRMLEKFTLKAGGDVGKLTQSFVKLVGQGFKPTEQELTKLGDLAASKGKEISQLAEAIIDAETGQFERLKEFGIATKKEGDNVIFTFKGVKTEVDNSAKSIREYILSLGDLKGVSGTMAAATDNIGGKLSNVRTIVEQISTSLGNRNSGVIGGFLDFVKDALTPLNEALNNQVTALQKEQNELNVLVGAITAVNVPTEVRAKLIEDLNRKYPDFLRNMDVEKVTNEQLVTRLKDVNEQFQRKILLVAAEKELAKTSERIIELVNKEAEARLRLEKINRGEFVPQASGGAGPDFTSNEEKIAIARAAAEETINLALEERNALTAENIEKLKRYQDALGLFNDTNNDYFTTEKDLAEVEKTREEIVKGLIAQMEKRLKLLQEQRKVAETPEEIRQLKIEIDGLTASLARLNALGAGVAPVIRDITSTALGVDKLLADGADRAFTRFEKEMDDRTKKKREVAKDLSDIYNSSFVFVDTLADLHAQGQQQRADQELANLQAVKDEELALVGDNARARERVEKEFEQKQKEIKARQAQRDKEQALFNIFVNTAQGVVAALASVPPNVFLSAAIGAIGFTQGIAVQTRELPKFRRGKYRVQGPGTSTSDSILAQISRDESVVPASRNSKFGFALKPIIENDNFTIKDLKDLVDAHVPMQLRGDLFYPPAASDTNSAQLDEVNRNLQRLLDKKELHLGIDEDGFKAWVRSGSSWTQYVDNRYSFDV